MPLLHRCRLETAGEPIQLPADVIARHPKLQEARWRRGGLPLRIGGWCLGRRTVAGFTLGRTIFIAPELLAPDATPPVRLLLHELAHVRQFRRDKSFPIRYLWESVRHGYSGNRYEAEAEQFVHEQVVQEIVW